MPMIESVLNTTSLCSPLLRDNPDITGIGVRVAFYVQAFLTLLLSYLPNVSDNNASYWSMTITAFALFVSALSLNHQDQLSLYLAISVSILLWLHAFATLLVMFGDAVVKLKDLDGRTYKSKEQHDFYQSMRIMRLSGVPVIAIAIAFSLFVWRHASTFGADPACNPHTVLVILGSHLTATTTGRIAALTISYICLFFFVFFALLDSLSLFLFHFFPEQLKPYASVEMGLLTPLFLLPIPHIGAPTARSLLPRALGILFLPIYFSLFIFAIFSFFARLLLEPYVLLQIFKRASIAFSILLPTALIVSNELTLNANSHLLGGDGRDSRDWTLGQWKGY
ncbi:uncharacterized protein STEHIDRAFT_152428 [Stereum hirsutum FP-91666 SS1]|uniref:uncharacterized protein n=1 Tax=Stereum hirsutum (strain FP-91666) TaxID=721885 RepID=UPI000440C955|nr:uncharacterized protein STEHIDRAFT_152428 [Stereum hirsutum FP-91666 SS1]EIM90726.1 hypothetical protein STEHIDRAFT_152428 [Stereum hirsutum FP-91666 SS1]